eukprot:jgi/Chrzof1/1398/Cz10g06110.t1
MRSPAALAAAVWAHQPPWQVVLLLLSYLMLAQQHAEFCQLFQAAHYVFVQLALAHDYYEDGSRAGSSCCRLLDACSSSNCVDPRTSPSVVASPLAATAGDDVSAIALGRCCSGSVWVLSTRTSRALTRADLRGEAKQTDRRTRQSANLQSTYSQQSTYSRLTVN